LKIEQGCISKILTNTIQAFLKHAPSWWSNAHAVVATLDIVGPNSGHPDLAVVARLESKEVQKDDFKTFLES
jgi:hypothetical protein